MPEKPLPNETPHPAATVFLSYAHADRDLVGLERLVRAFEYWKWTVESDRDNPNLGESWPDTIRPRVDNSYTLLLALSRNAVQSHAIGLEINWTLERGSRLKFLPVIIEPGVSPPEHLWTEHGVDLSTWLGDPNDPLFERVLNNIENLWTIDNGMQLIRSVKTMRTMRIVKRREVPE